MDSPVAEDSSTPLHKACAGSKPGHLASSKLLINAGADVHALNKWRETPLLTAANHGQVGAVEALLAADADPCRCTDTGWSPLSIAAYKGHDEVVRLLLEEGAPTEEDDPTLSALLQAATKGLPDTVELLLSHGADHTVTTKKGDTALSILVEQNLIDAAVEMVTEYNASIPRCSRDRKKVQRARLLINLRTKQLEREGKGTGGSTDEEVSDEDDSAPNVAQHIGNGSSRSTNGPSAEEKARAAEEALLRELEREDAQAKREEIKASSKQAKKKKRKERERQQRLKDEQERRAREEEEEKERERIKLEKEEKRRREQERRLQEEREKREKELMEREKVMAAKRKEREEREKRMRKQQLSKRQQAERQVNCVSPANSLPKPNDDNKSQKAPKMPITDPTPSRKIVSPKGSNKPMTPLGGNRRWETSAKSIQSMPAAAPISDTSAGSEDVSLQRQLPSPSDSALNDARTSLSLPQVPRAGSAESASAISHEKSVGSGTGSIQAPQHSPANILVEHPAIAVFRYQKVVEFLRSCSESVSLVSTRVLKRVLYRWIIRASNGNPLHRDPIIPSWAESEDLETYFQRQFIAESRHDGSLTFSSMESLKEAGSYVAALCQTKAQQLAEYRYSVGGKLKQDWSDASVPINVQLINGSSDVTLSWSDQARTTLSTMTFAMLRERYVGPPSRILAAIFSTKIAYDTAGLIASDTGLDFRLTPTAQASLTDSVRVSAELWSDPFSVLSGNVFWGRFELLDSLFGGQKPFGKDELGSEEVLTRHGGSLSACLPIDTMIASQVIRRMVDILEKATSNGAAVSFAVVVNAECLPDQPNGLSPASLKCLDPRLGTLKDGFASRVETLSPGKHFYCSGFGTTTPIASPTSSLLVFLQNVPGKARYPVNDAVLAQILNSMSLGSTKKATTPPPIGIPGESQLLESPAFEQAGYLSGLDPVSPDPSRAIRSEFGAIGGSRGAFSPASDSMRSSTRGRLFDLVDSEDEEPTEDIMSGMLNSLDLGLFQTSNAADNVDIEAISLMGIGGPPSGSLSNSGHHSTGRLG